jgi:DNA-directed RNA polymerase specialized sigma subunit
MPAPRQQKYCTMNCSGGQRPCGDCGTETVHGDPISARDAEIADLRIGVLELYARIEELEARLQERGYLISNMQECIDELTQKSVARKLGISQAAVSHAERKNK